MKKYIIIAVIIAIALVSINNQNTPSKVYTDSSSRFSITLDNGWNLSDNSNSSTTSNTLFSNGSSTIVVKRFDRTETVNKAIEFMGNMEFGNFLIEQLVIDIGNQYKITATSSVQINGLNFLAADATYITPNTRKEVTQKTYIVINDKEYYIIGTDIYTDILNRDFDEIEKIIKSFILL